ncbi:HWE histidine kinase domain-containing protein [Erythrobacter donghaensis]|uniref:HWE histidine kinase domain-containing protein n=3 Tax=Erythrobacter donghaensis TaxID=267135 RepID=UPI00093F3B17|nr:HWE histidine kinase domain-containing protein [Erythrobacter donghaensis]
MAKADRVSEPPTRVLRWFERVQIADFHPLTRLAGTLAIFAAAWAARVLLDPMLPSGFPYVTFFPAVILTAFLFGLRAGLLSALLCGGVAWYFFIPPLNSFSIAGAEVAIGLYVFVVGTDLVLLHGMRAANRQLRLERQNSLDLAAAKEQQAEELRRAIAAVRDSEVKTQLATRTAGMGIWQWHIPSDRVQWDETMFALYGMAPTPDGTVRYGDYIAHLHPEDAEAQDTRLKRTVAEVSESTREFRIRRSDDSRWRQLRAVEVARAGPDGRTEWVVGTNLDITAEKERESHIRLLLGEVNHRAKNLLAVVLSVARRTSGSDHETFMTNFAARIQSLAAGQDLLVRNAWRGVGLQALVAAQLGHFKDLVGSRILIEGEEIALAPPAVQTLGMVLHELVTNASKHGALSNERGQVRLHWERRGNGAEARFVLMWSESGGPPVAPPATAGFGTVVIGDMVRNTLDAEVESRFDPQGFVWRLDCAIGNIVEHHASVGILR